MNSSDQEFYATTSERHSLSPEKKARLSEMRERLIAARQVNLEEMVSIRGQIDAAKANATANGIYANAHWFASANSALRHRQVKDQELIREIKSLKERIEPNRNASLEKAFVDASRQILPDDKFRSILEIAMKAVR